MFEIWPGFSPVLIFNNNSNLINIDYVSKIITNTNLLGEIDRIKRQ